MLAAALAALSMLGSVTSLIPTLAHLVPQIQNLFNSIKSKGKVSPEDERAINALKVEVHAEVVRLQGTILAGA